MIEIMYPKTVENILDYDGIKAAAKKYVEDVFLEIVKSFGENLILQTMDEEHLSVVTKNVAGVSMSIDDFLDYINTDNIYREYDFVSELYTAFPNGVEYKAFDVTGHDFPSANFEPFNAVNRSYRNGNPRPDCVDEVWEDNAQSEPFNNLLMSRFGRQRNGEVWDWKKVSGRRASWGETSTWMTTGGFGKPASIHINVDEERTILTENGLSSVENWLGTVSNKLPINLYIEINDEFLIRNSVKSVNGLAGSSDGYYMSFPYEEEETICTNDPNWGQEVYYTNKRYEGEGTLFIYVNYNNVTGESKVILADRYGNENKVPNIYVDRQTLSDISGIPISELDENFWQFMAESEDVEVYHQSVQIARLSLGEYPVVHYYGGLEGEVDETFVGFGTMGLNFVTPISNLDTDPHIFDEIDENWYSLHRLGNGEGFIQFNSPDALAVNKYIRRVDDLCNQKYKSHILDVTKTHIINGENGKPSVSIVNYLEQNEFGSTFIFTMPFNWFGARYAFDNKGNEWNVTKEIEPEPEPPVPPEPPVVENPDYYILDDTTGAILHSINSPLSNAKPSAVTISGNIEHIDNPPTPPAPQNEILLGLFYQDGWQSKTFATNDYWYSGVVNSSDVDYLRSIGLGLTTVSGTYGPNGCIYYQTGYSFELIGLYSDLGETPVTYDPANFYISYRNIANENIFTINNYSAFDAIKTYKVRITKNS